MKKMLLILLSLILIVSIVIGCSNNEVEEPDTEIEEIGELDKEEEKEIETQQEIEDETNDEEPEEKVEDSNREEAISEDKNLKTEEEYREMIKYEVGEGETVESIELVNNNIIITVDLGEENEFLSPKELAESRYASITDELLENGGDLNYITVEFVGVGEITMNTSEKESNQFGDYFDSLDVQKNFK